MTTNIPHQIEGLEFEAGTLTKEDVLEAMDAMLPYGVSVGQTTLERESRGGLPRTRQEAEALSPMARERLKIDIDGYCVHCKHALGMSSLSLKLVSAGDPRFVHPECSHNSVVVNFFHDKLKEAYPERQIEKSALLKWLAEQGVASADYIRRIMLGKKMLAKQKNKKDVYLIKTKASKKTKLLSDEDHTTMSRTKERLASKIQTTGGKVSQQSLDFIADREIPDVFG